mgnify:CR=1 FL=1
MSALTTPSRGSRFGAVADALRAVKHRVEDMTFRERVEEHDFAGRRLKVTIADKTAAEWYGVDCPRLKDFELLAGRGLNSGALVFDVGAHQGVVAMMLAGEVGAAGFLSGRSTHADRLTTIRDVQSRYGVVVDPHTADGIKVGREHRDPDVPLVCVETALPAKFAATIREALGREPGRPDAFVGLEARPQKCVTLPARAAAVRDYLVAYARPAA